MKRNLNETPVRNVRIQFCEMLLGDRHKQVVAKCINGYFFHHFFSFFTLLLFVTTVFKFAHRSIAFFFHLVFSTYSFILFDSKTLKFFISLIISFLEITSRHYSYSFFRGDGAKCEFCNYIFVSKLQFISFTDNILSNFYSISLRFFLFAW